MQNYNDRNRKKIKLYKENYNYLENFESENEKNEYSPSL